MAIVGPPGGEVDGGIAPTDTPAVFLQQYGRAVASVVTVQAGIPYKIPPDTARNLFVVWGTTALVTVLPDGSDTSGMTGPQVAPGGSPLIITFASHLQLVNMGWSISAGPGATVTVILGRQDAANALRPSKRRLKICRLR